MEIYHVKKDVKKEDEHMEIVMEKKNFLKKSCEKR